MKRVGRLPAYQHLAIPRVKKTERVLFVVGTSLAFIVSIIHNGWQL